MDCTILNTALLCIQLFNVLLLFVAPTEGILPPKWAEVANNVILPYKVDTFPRSFSVGANNNNNNGQLLEVMNLFKDKLGNSVLVEK